MERFYNKIRIVREALNLSQEWVADQIGISQSHYSRVESGLVSRLSNRRLLQIARALEVAPQEIGISSASLTTTTTTPQPLLVTTPEVQPDYCSQLLEEKDARILLLTEEVGFLRKMIDRLEAERTSHS